MIVNFSFLQICPQLYVYSDGLTEDCQMTYIGAACCLFAFSAKMLQNGECRVVDLNYK